MPPMAIADASADGCCSVCEMFGTCGFAFLCKCHRSRGAIETSMADLNAAAREVPKDRWADNDPEYAL